LVHSHRDFVVNTQPAPAPRPGPGLPPEAARHWGEPAFRRLLDKLPAAAYTCDPDGLITYFNSWAVATWGRAPKLNDPIDRFCGSFKLFAADGPALRHDQCWMALALRNNREYNGEEIIVERPDGERRTVLAYANPVHDESGKLLGAVNVLVDITERTQIEQQLRRSERELADFFENATLGLHWVGPDGIILRANRAELELLGYTAEEYIGRHITEFHADAEVIADILCRLQAGEELHSYEARLRCKNGSIRHVIISSNVLRENGKFVHTRCFTRDISERKKAEEALREASRQKDEFLAMLAHELRNPLAPVRVAVQLLRMQESAPPQSCDALEVIDRQMRQMTRLIDDLLDVSRITRGKLELRRQRVELAEVVRAAVETSRPLLESAGHTLTVDVPSEPMVLDADATRLAQAIANLLNNAARYTERGGQVWLSVERQGSDAVVTVRDTGAGIPAEMLGHIF
jgi:PAS domain S-box-containing protein